MAVLSDFLPHKALHANKLIFFSFLTTYKEASELDQILHVVFSAIIGIVLGWLFVVTEHPPIHISGIENLLHKQESRRYILSHWHLDSHYMCDLPPPVMPPYSRS